MWTSARAEGQTIYLTFGGIGFKKFLYWLKHFVPAMGREYDPRRREWRIDLGYIEDLHSVYVTLGLRNPLQKTLDDWRTTSVEDRIAQFIQDLQPDNNSIDSLQQMEKLELW